MMNYPYFQDRIWVKGEAGAGSYLVAPNCSAILWDSENPVIYIKSADANGIPSMEILDYTKREVVSDYVTKTEYEKLLKRISELEKGVSDESTDDAAVTTKPKKQSSRLSSE